MKGNGKFEMVRYDINGNIIKPPKAHKGGVLRTIAYVIVAILLLPLIIDRIEV